MASSRISHHQRGFISQRSSRGSWRRRQGTPSETKRWLTESKRIHRTLKEEQDKADKLKSAHVSTWPCFLSRIPKLSHMPWAAPAQEHLGTVPALQEGCRGKALGQVPSFLQLLLG